MRCSSDFAFVLASERPAEPRRRPAAAGRTFRLSCFLGLFFLSGSLFTANLASAATPLFAPPTGGWTYTYDGQTDAFGTATATPVFDALDGTWDHSNNIGSDTWDGSAPGAGNPGGVAALTDGLGDAGAGSGDADYLRLQDTGDPRDYGFPDNSNRKLFFGRDLTADGISTDPLAAGAVLSFRARVASSGTLDDAHPNGGDVGDIVAWPAGGDGYVIHNSGKGNFGIGGLGGIISFSLITPAETAVAGFATGGLLMNALNIATPTEISDDVDTGDVFAEVPLATLNFFPIDDVTEWTEFFIEITPDGVTGTHEVSIRIDGSATATTFSVTAGSGVDYNDETATGYIALGLGNTSESGAIDVDFFSVQATVAIDGDYNGNGIVDAADYVVWRDGFSPDDSSVGYDLWKSNFGNVAGSGSGTASAPIPEPSTWALFLLGMLGIVAAAGRSRNSFSRAGS